MWKRMHKKKKRRNVPHLLEEDDRDLEKLPRGITQKVTEAVQHYNRMVSLSRYIEGRDVTELLMKQAEEEDAKVFLDGIFDIMQKQE